MKSNTQYPGRVRCIPYLFVALWLGLMAVLFAWKGMTYAEWRAIRLFLDQPMSTSTTLWWGGSVLFVVYAVFVLICLARHRTYALHPTEEVWR